MIPFSKTTLGEEEKKAVADVIDSGWVVQGKVTNEFEQKFAEYVGSQYAVFVDSGTSALFLAIKYLKHSRLWGGSTIEVPSFTFTATAEALVQGGMIASFADVSMDDYCLLDVDDRTLPVHFGGTRAKDGALIYDSAHRIEKDDVKGSDALWCYSLYASKNMTTVQGGMIATNSEKAYKWLCLARDHGLDLGTQERYHGAYKQYDVKFIGWRRKGDDFRAAVGIEQLKKLPINTEIRNTIVSKYNEAFGRDWKGNHLYPIVVDDNRAFMDYMFDKGIQCAVHYRPLDKMTAYSTFAKRPLNNTDYLEKHLVSIPLFPQLTEDEIGYIIKETHQSGMLLI